MKRIAGLLCAVVMMVALVACGNASGSGTTWQEQYDLGMQYLTDGNYEAAIVAFTAAIEIDAKDIQAYTGLVQAYIGTGDYEAAVSAAGQGADVLGDSGQEQADGAIDEFTAVLLTLGEVCLGDGDYESAEMIYSLIIGIDENLVDAYIARAEAYLELGEQEKALEDYRKALELLQQGEAGNITEDELEALIAGITEVAEVEEPYIDDASLETDTNEEDKGIIYVLTKMYEVYANGNRELIHEYTYNETGTILNSIGYETDPDGTLVTEYILTEENEELPLYQYVLDNKGEIMHSYEYTYDDINLISIVYYFYGVEYYRTEYTYDESGNVLTEYEYSEHPESKFLYGYDYQYAYDLNGNVVNKIMIRHETNEKMQEESYTYDESGNVLTDIIIYPIYEQQVETVYTYDDNGNVLSYTYNRYEEGDLTNQTETLYTYENDNLISIISYQDGEETVREEYSYGEHGNVIIESHYYYGELIWQYEYIYTAISK